MNRQWNMPLIENQVRTHKSDIFAVFDIAFGAFQLLWWLPSNCACPNEWENNFVIFISCLLCFCHFYDVWPFGRAVGWTIGQRDGRLDGRSVRRTVSRTDGRTDSRTDGGTVGRAIGRTHAFVKKEKIVSVNEKQ